MAFIEFLKGELEKWRSEFRSGVDELQPYNHRPLSADENLRRNEIIETRILRAKNYILRIESELSYSLVGGTN
jgi:hypothetical protein